MKLIIDVPEEDYKFVKEAEGCRYSKTVIDGVINGTPIPDNATNLDVFSAIFKGTPDISICPIFCISKDDIKCQCDVDTCACGDWWDAPYKGGE